MKRQKDRTLEDKHHNHPPPPATGQKASNMLLEKSGGQLLIAPARITWLGQSRNFFLDIQLWMRLVVKVKSNSVKNNVA